MLTYAIGDIHGRHDLLERLLEKIRDHAGGRPHRLVLLGDYIDRGPDSAGVVETVRALQAGAPDRVVPLMGNHEAMLLTALRHPAALEGWLLNGGIATLASYRVTDPHRIPAGVRAWLGTLPTSYEDEWRVFVHAGLMPGRPLSDQTEMDKIWIREPFLAADYDFGKHVVHGHTPLRSTDPEILRHRTNLDTAAVFGGALTAGVFEDGRGAPCAVLQVT
ncbi:metallophosphoesterase family protein [Microvirga thermotolerans]|uniref:Serine/threonine protein phosphatase n=1 Tax=Microvirga thermotolerans TaxID=2651334 RepID=A0A5P9JWN4_9HYPH|nr:metallophosphoesterase family protein [Microvirga thermotolerans]QFU17007.1 serine/threonine protein phosphatase [Microvirga thermotolerans]